VSRQSLITEDKKQQSQAWVYEGKKLFDLRLIQSLDQDLFLVYRTRTNSSIAQTIKAMTQASPAAVFHHIGVFADHGELIGWLSQIDVVLFVHHMCQQPHSQLLRQELGMVFFAHAAVKPNDPHKARLSQQRAVYARLSRFILLNTL
jgi:hypothetical protein